jgi:peptidoglycan DL-endopeptidase LytF
MPRFSWASRGLATTALSMLLMPLAVYAEPGPTSVHVVQSGETLLQIALDAGTDTATVAALNGLGDANVLSIGQTLKVPAKSSSGSAAASSVTAVRASTATAPSGSSYTIVSGDNLWDVAQRYGTTTDAIVQLNHLDDAEHLSLGAVLSLPAGAQPRATATASSSTSASTASAQATPAPASSSAASSTTSSRRSLMVSYTVQPGETLMQIARRFDVRADTIVQASSLPDANLLPVGSVLKVPVAAKEHKVAEGETLRDIASSEKVDLGSLIDFNQIDDPSLIRVGQLLLLPTAADQASSAAAAVSSRPTAAATPAAPATSTSVATAVAVAAAPPEPDTQTAAVVTPQPRASATATSTPTVKPAATTASTPAAPKPSTTPTSASTSTKPAPKPAAPVAVVAPPPGAPTDGLAGQALKFLGTPYVWGGSNPSGFDCSGFVWYIGRQLNKQLSRGMLGQYNSGSHPSRDELKPGDLVFFQNTWAPGLSHNGVYIGNNQFVNAADESSGVTISSLNSAYWSGHWFGATRLP